MSPRRFPPPPVSPQVKIRQAHSVSVARPPAIGVSYINNYQDSAFSQESATMLETPILVGVILLAIVVVLWWVYR